MVYLDIFLTAIMLSICAYTDMKSNKIPHVVVWPVALLGLLNTALLFDWNAALWQGAIAFVALIIGYVLYRFKMCGGGDVFLVVSMICTIGWQYALLVLSIGMICGVFYALFIYIFKKPEEKKIMIPLALMCAISFIIVTGFNLYMLRFA